MVRLPCSNRLLELLPFAKMSKPIVAVGPESSALNSFNQVGSARLVASDFVLSKVW